MVSYINDSNQVTFDSTNQVLTDSVAISSSFQLPDTFKVVDVSNYIEHPAFLLSLLTIVIALFAILKPIIDKKNTQKKLKEYTLFFAKQMIDTFDEKISQVKETAQKIRDIDATEYVYTVSLTYRASNLLSLPQIELFQIFVSKNEDSDHSKDFIHFKGLFDAIAYFVSHDGQAQKNYENFLSAARRNEDKFSDNINAIIRHFDRLRSNADLTGTKPSQDPFLKEFDKILSDWKKLDNYNSYSIVNGNLLNPLEMIAKKYIIDTRALILLERVVECNIADYQLRNAKKVFSKVFEELTVTLEKNRNSLADAIKYFNNIK